MSANETTADGNHDGHDHGFDVTAGNERRMRIVFGTTAGYALIQAIGGWLSGSLALIANSGHMISDAAALLLALIAYRVARRAATAEVSYGYHRVRVLAALANGASLLILVAWITFEAIARFRDPVEVLAGPMLAVAIIGLCVNIAGAVILRGGDSEDANMRGALLHVMGDLLGSVGAIAAAIGIMLTGYTILDPSVGAGGGAGGTVGLVARDRVDLRAVAGHTAQPRSQGVARRHCKPSRHCRGGAHARLDPGRQPHRGNGACDPNAWRRPSDIAQDGGAAAERPPRHRPRDGRGECPRTNTGRVLTDDGPKDF